MPRSWHDRHEANRIEDDEQRALYRRIVADKKPYFMRYIYPDLMRKYNTYIKNTNKSALREFQMTVDELMSKPYSELTERQAEFLRYYKYRMPVGTNDCVMNKICKKFEAAFDGYVGRYNSSANFDFGIMKSDAEYTPKQYTAVKRIYEDYNRRVKNFAIFSYYERVDEFDARAAFDLMDDEFIRQCYDVCSNEDELCNLILDLCYSRSSSKRFAWGMCGSKIINNLLRKNNNQISYPVQDDDGDVVFCGKKFSVETQKIEVDE